MIRRAAALLAAWAAAGAVAIAPASCPGRFIPPAAPMHGTDLNGFSLPDACFNVSGPHHVFVIGDWGGVFDAARGVQPADHRNAVQFPNNFRPYVKTIDDFAQQRVAQQMIKRAAVNEPDYVLNVGDNFYWGGIDTRCGAPAFQHVETGQWVPIFENMYRGPGLDGKQWLSILGNHDYGGYTFTSGWDQQIAYTWGAPGSTGRWVMPSQFWKAKVWYPDFAVDYYFVDTNVFDAWEPISDANHNLCSLEHNPTPATCGPQGPESAWDCPRWFGRLWDVQMKWMEKHLAESTADWQIVVTHFPPVFGREDWVPLSEKFGIDLIVTGHQHRQYVVGPEDEGNFLKPTAYIVSGGGGGITSEDVPDLDGEDDQYGFVDLTLNKSVIMIEAISHGGKIRSTTAVRQRSPAEHDRWHYTGRHDNRTEEEENRTKARKHNADVVPLKRCDGTICPAGWLAGAGGYYCIPTKACRGPEQGPFANASCSDQCYIGEPPLTYLPKNATRNGVQQCLQVTTCPADWTLNEGGYFCEQTGLCRVAADGPFGVVECQKQCYIGMPPPTTTTTTATMTTSTSSTSTSTTSTLTTITTTTNTSTTTTTTRTSSTSTTSATTTRTATLTTTTTLIPASELANVLRSELDRIRLRNGVARCSEATACPPEWASGGGGYWCMSTRGCRDAALGPWPAEVCPQQCYLGRPPERRDPGAHRPVPAPSTTTTVTKTLTATLPPDAPGPAPVEFASRWHWHEQREVQV